MKAISYKIGILLVGMCAMLFTSCLSDGDDTMVLEKGEKIEQPDEPEGDPTKVVSSDESATVSSGGFELTVPKGSVPKNDSGENGRVAFSISHVDEADLPKGLPAGASLFGDNSIKIEPMNFVFSSPLVLRCPAGNNVALLRYNDFTDSWETVPFSSRNADGSYNASLIELGYFVLVEYPQQLSQLGGVRVSARYLSEEYYYYLTLIPVDGTDGSVKKIAYAPNGSPLYMVNVAKGTYTAVLSREKRTQLSATAENIEYSETRKVTVDKNLVAGDGGYSTYTGWTDIDFSNVKWYGGRTSAWGNTTTTYGTGKFQATLTWVNHSTSTYTDYDLHLYGPDVHVYFSNKHEGCFELDRDWIKDPGNAVENIYSISDNFTPGEYHVKVHHFSGQLGKRYNCRVIMNGVVVKSVSGSISTNSAYDEIYTFTVE